MPQAFWSPLYLSYLGFRFPRQSSVICGRTFQRRVPIHTKSICFFLWFWFHFKPPNCFVAFMTYVPNSDWNICSNRTMNNSLLVCKFVSKSTLSSDSIAGWSYLIWRHMFYVGKRWSRLSLQNCLFRVVPYLCLRPRTVNKNHCTEHSHSFWACSSVIWRWISLLCEFKFHFSLFSDKKILISIRWHFYARFLCFSLAVRTDQKKRLDSFPLESCRRAFCALSLHF